MCKNYTHNKTCISCDFLCVLSVLVQTTQNCIFDVTCHVIFCMILVQLKPCTIIISVISLVTKSASYICCMPISDHSGHHCIDKFSLHVCFSVWTVSCYLYVYNREWCHLYSMLHTELCP